ncbi:MAG: hypothetical protein D3922_07310, partial [Candidatus Electrothrix sp. AR1]|nr:hypothetical protein [Candidatus Electrothrix sp. AR1]
MGACENNRQLLEGRKETLELKIKEIEENFLPEIGKELKNKQKCLEQWAACLEKREETKNAVQKEMNSAFIPCFVKKKAQEFHNCLKCYRRTAACVLQKKQEVKLMGCTKKLVEKQLALVKADKDQNYAFLLNFKKIQNDIESSHEKIKENRLTDKAKFLLNYIDNEPEQECQDKKYSEEDLKKIVADLKLEGDIDSPLVFSDKKKDIENGINFIQAKKRMHRDFSFHGSLRGGVNFVQLAMVRRGLLRYYDQKGAELLDCLTQKISSKNDLEGYKLVFDSKKKKYDKCVSTAETDYDAAMTLFSEIVDSQKLTRSQQKCIKADCGRNEALQAEKEYLENWEKVNSHRICLQTKNLSNLSENREMCG